MSVVGWPIAITVCLLLRSGCAWADTAAPAQTERTPRQQAREHFQRAERAYSLTRYQDAIGHYEKAYMVYPKPAFLFNLAQAYRRQHEIDHQSNHLRRALTLYKNYLRDAPGSRNRALVHEFIDQIEISLKDADHLRPLSGFSRRIPSAAARLGDGCGPELRLSDGRLAQALFNAIGAWLLAPRDWLDPMTIRTGQGAALQWLGGNGIQPMPPFPWQGNRAPPL